MGRKRKKKLLIEEADNAAFALHEYGVLPATREVFLAGDVEAIVTDDFPSEPGVEFVMANRFTRNLRLLAAAGSDPILVHMKTCGGYWEEGMAIYDAIRTSPCPVTILSYTHARSMSSIILQAATRRFLMPNSCFMFHLGESAFSGEGRAAWSQAEFFRLMESTMVRIYVESMSRTQGGVFWASPEAAHDWVTEQMEKKGDVFLTAEEAVRYGLADKVFDGYWAELSKKRG